MVLRKKEQTKVFLVALSCVYLKLWLARVLNSVFAWMEIDISVNINLSSTHLVVTVKLAGTSFFLTPMWSILARIEHFSDTCCGVV